MTLEFFRFELREQLRSPVIWLLALLFAALAFSAAGSETIQIGGSIGNIHRNAPTVVATWLALFSFLGMLIVTLVVSSALLRDFDQGTAELVFSAPVRRRDYLAGRLAAAFVISLSMYVLVGIGMFVAQFMPWVEPERLGPVSLTPYVWGFGVFVIPNLLFTGALLALLAALTRSILWVYIGVIAFFVLYGVSGVILADLDNRGLASMLEPLGIRAMANAIRYWSVDERNARLPELSGYLVANRAIWLGAAFALLAATFALFKTARTGTARRRWGRGAAPSPATLVTPAATRPLAVPRVQPRFGASTAWHQFMRQLRFDTLGVFRSVPFLVLLAFAMANFLPSALYMESAYGTGIYPVTSQMVRALQQSYSFLLVIIVLFYAGELVWKERGAKINEVTDAMPVPNWVPLLAKFGALVAVVIAFQAIGVVTAVAIQLSKGYTAIEPLVYLQALAVDSVIFVLMGGLALALQVFSNNKFVGYALLILVMLSQLALDVLDFTHHLYTFGGWPDAPYSDMNGYGHFLREQLWFQSYWAAFLLALMLLANALWVRGVAMGRKQRWSLARQRLHGGPGLALAASLAAFAAIGGFLFWNTNIRNDFRSPEEQLDLQANYEKTYGKYRSLPQPRIVAVDTDVDLRPETQELRVAGRYRVRNVHATPIRDVHVLMQDDEWLVDIDLGGAELVTHDKDMGYRIYRLAEPLQPGDERAVSFKLDFRADGMTGHGAPTQVVENGTFFNNTVFPSFGYSERRELAARNDRRERGLGEPRRMAKLEDEAARANTYLGTDSDWIDYTTTICTAPDQVALAPGYLVREFKRDGRRCFSYEMDRPMLNFFAYLSGRWEVKRDTYNGIPIEIYHDERHGYNVDRMIDAVKKSLAYYEANFTPYQHRQVRIIEFPGYATFAQSFANTIPYSEAIGFIADLRDPDDVDYVFYVTAHEVAHQWWAHQVIGANVQGATMLSETLSQYSALMVMEKEYGRAHMRQFLKTELDRYLSGRSGELVDEQPLYRVEDQQYVHYRKGSLVLYRLREELGEAALNRALKKFLEAKAYQSAPFPTSAELLTFIRAEARPDQQALITDLFEKISFYDNRVEAASATRRPDGRYDVRLDLHAAKRYADGKGKESAGTLDDWIEVGVFANGPSGEERDQKVLYLKRHRIDRESPTLTVTVDERPDEAGFDPYNKLIDRVSSDNRKKVTL
ncbi:ABC transporter permease/M1 family aminopeptidase [Cognatilysobacter bugurensis]|uniref:Peptidase M1 membrane alanine aminopeptidase domain-containing protein n=1 Tax=Cognatilysobacter bugurensis TaxID=543356 RepID=A0A918SV59_9GAMM|nr:M1 family aminopeptidase [Lysobacter bugurensis]GHA72322.1 hypothetical protein GCM10007067_06010 [Lysobacter bugurensis]